MARIVVSGYIARYPLAGNVLAHLQYVLGFARLGHEVWFVEDAGWADSCYDPERDEMTSDPSYGVGLLGHLMRQHGLDGRWAFRDGDGRWHGQPGAQILTIIADADLYLEVGGVSHFPEMAGARVRAYVDMDPVFTQLGGFAHDRLGAFDALFTYGTNVGKPGCAVPTLGLVWHPLLPPVVMDLWRPLDKETPDGGSAGAWTTVTTWNAYGAIESGGETFGQKDVEFLRFIDLPAHVAVPIEVAVGGEDVPYELFRRHGWRIVDPLLVSRDLTRYQQYIRSSRGELSVAKNAYVKSGCGWFSDRSAAYLASGRPVVTQDTGMRDPIRPGCGFLAFGTPEEAAAALSEVESRYEEHAAAARAVAETYLDSDRVLSRLLEVCGV